MRTLYRIFRVLQDPLADGEQLEFRRWIQATAIASIIILALLLLAVLLHSFNGHQPKEPKKARATKSPLTVDVNFCKSDACKKYADLFSRCQSHDDADPCQNFKQFVCGTNLCPGMTPMSLYDRMVTLAAEEELRSSKTSGKKLGASGKSAYLYSACLNNRSWNNARKKVDFVVKEDLLSFLHPDTPTVALITRLAARYQDGVLFYLDVGSSKGLDGRPRLAMKVNPHLGRSIAAKMTSHGVAGNHSRVEHFREWIVNTDETRSAVHTTEADHTESEIFQLWMATIGNGTAWSQTLNVEDLGTYGIPPDVFLSELQAVNLSIESSNEIEVMDHRVLTFVQGAVRMYSPQVYIIDEFLKHMGDFASYARRGLASHLSRNEVCFQCVQRATGLAAHAPFLFSVLSEASRRVLNTLLDQIVRELTRNINSVTWLSAPQKETLLKHLNDIKFVIGFPKQLDNMSKLEDYYSFLPNPTGNFFVDYHRTALASRSKALGNATVEFPLLASVPNVLSGKGTVFISAAALLPPLFDHQGLTAVNFGSLGWALTRALLHNLGLTGLAPLPLPEAESAAAVSHLASLSRCLAPNENHRVQADSVADALAAETALAASQAATPPPREGGAHGLHDTSLDVKRFFAASCFLWCGRRPGTCDTITEHSRQFAAAFQCPATSLMGPAGRCGLWGRS